MIAQKFTKNLQQLASGNANLEGMKDWKNQKLISAGCIVASIFLAASQQHAADALSIPRNEKERITAPSGVAPLTGLAAIVTKQNADAWSIQLTVPKVIWEVVGEDRPKIEATEIKADVKLITMDVPMSYSPATQLADEAQNRVVDLKGNRLSREEAQKRLVSSTPVLVSFTGKLPDSFYLQCLKSDTLVVIFGLPSSSEFDLLPNERLRQPAVK